ncbi:MAG: hypothetical protein QOE25_593 [Actinomycetota bacterium]|nr:hypothetical protein [Actinomycetota bacterium]
MKRLVLGVAITISVFFPASPASAAKPTIERFPADQSFVDHSCGFAVRVHVTGIVIQITRTDASGNVRTFQSYPRDRQTLTNVKTGTTITTSLSGPQHFTQNADGSSALAGTGPWAWSPNPVTGDPGIFLTEGRFILASDSQGNGSFSTVGRVVALCPKLAG